MLQTISIHRGGDNRCRPFYALKAVPADSRNQNRMAVTVIFLRKVKHIP